jgi:hypothetical protein
MSSGSIVMIFGMILIGIGACIHDKDCKSNQSELNKILEKLNNTDYEIKTGDISITSKSQSPPNIKTWSAESTSFDTDKVPTLRLAGNVKKNEKDLGKIVSVKSLSIQSETPESNTTDKSKSKKYKYNISFSFVVEKEKEIPEVGGDFTLETEDPNVKTTFIRKS